MFLKSGQSVRDKYGSYGENWRIVSQNHRDWNLSSSDVDRLLEKDPISGDVWLEDIRWVNAIRMLNDPDYAVKMTDKEMKRKEKEMKQDIDLKIAYTKVKMDMLSSKILGYFGD